PHEIALVAVGGYGRAELFPYSDVDVLVLLPDDLVLEEADLKRKSIEEFIARSWDLGLRIGSSVRTISECLEESAKDITVQTALLESRLIAGNPELYAQFVQRYFEQMDSTKFVQAKLSEMRRRHRKYGNTPYALESNCKESPGGLRDLHVILWITKACKLGSNWHELKQNELLTELEERQLRHSEAWLKLVRVQLHLDTKRHEDRLIFDVQEKIATSLNYKPTLSRRASEVFMRRYYRTAKIIAQINHIFISGIDERILNNQVESPSRHVNGNFSDRAGMLDIVHADLYEQHPEQILQTFLIYAQESDRVKTFSARTFRALYNARRLVNASFRQNPVNKEIFLHILKSPLGISRTFDLMNQTGILERYLPAFGNIIGQMQHDLFHVYTVDQHTLTVLRNIRHFFIPEHAQEYPLCSEIAAGLDKPWLLYIAALFHDIAKGRQGDHSILGAQEVARFARQHGLSSDESQQLEFLVANHLTFSHIAQKEDIGDPEVIQKFIELVSNEHNLNALYLLTVADIRGTSPKVWNNWKSHLLEHFYQIVLHAMGGHMPDPAALVNTRKREAINLL
ncbi:MAG: [protein-PII] uridylyltransferase, partial [Saezia sp.]